MGGRLRRTTPDGQVEYAILGRAWWPVGWAPFAGHARDTGQASPEAALVAEGSEELDVTVVACTPLVTVHLPNLCQSLPAEPRPGHLWTVFDVEIAPGSVLRPDPEETTGAEWVSREELQRLADVTVAFALTGRAAAEQPRLSLEAVWVELFALTGDITASPAGLRAVERLYTTPPAEYWVG